MSVRSITGSVFLVLLFGVINVSSFNPGSYKPYQWDWEAQIKDFDNLPQLPCPTKDFRPCICKSDPRKSTYFIDCSGTVKTGKVYQLQAPHNATNLRIRFSDFDIIPSGSFDQLSRLIYLDLSWNSLSIIDSHAFVGLGSLRVLDLSGNELEHPAVLLPLQSLQVLNLCYCGIDFSFMDTISDLKQLEKLAFTTSVLSKDDVLKFQNTSVTYLSIDVGEQKSDDNFFFLS